MTNHDIAEFLHGLKGGPVHEALLETVRQRREASARLALTPADGIPGILFCERAKGAQSALLFDPLLATIHRLSTTEKGTHDQTTEPQVA